MLLCPPFWLQPTDLEEAGAPGWVCRCHYISFNHFLFSFIFGGGGRSKMHASVNCSAPQLLNGCIFVLPSHAVYIHVWSCGAERGCPCVRPVHKHVRLQVSAPHAFIVPGNCWPHPPAPRATTPRVPRGPLNLTMEWEGVTGPEPGLKTNHSDGQQRQGGRGWRWLGLGGA